MKKEEVRNKKIATGIVTDFMASSMSTPEEERKEICDILESWGLDINLKYSEDAISDELPKLDLLVIDYGGLSFGYGDYPKTQVREAVRWAQDHPGSLLIVWTSFTWRIYHYELEDKFGNLDNVKFWYPPTETYIGFEEERKYQSDLVKFVRLWFGIAEECGE